MNSFICLLIVFSLGIGLNATIFGSFAISIQILAFVGMTNWEFSRLFSIQFESPKYVHIYVNVNEFEVFYFKSKFQLD